MNQHPIAIGREAALEQIDPDGEQGLRHRRRFDQRQAGGDRQAGAGRCGAIFGISAARDQRADLLPKQMLCVAARFDDGPGDLEPENVGRARRRRISPRRWRMSGRLTPAAATLTNTSFDPGRGTGRSTSANSSAPSGWGATTAIIEEGMSATAAAY